MNGRTTANFESQLQSSIAYFLSPLLLKVPYSNSKHNQPTILAHPMWCCSAISTVDDSSFSLFCYFFFCSFLLLSFLATFFFPFLVFVLLSLELTVFSYHSHHFSHNKNTKKLKKITHSLSRSFPSALNNYESMLLLLTYSRQYGYSCGCFCETICLECLLYLACVSLFSLSSFFLYHIEMVLSQAKANARAGVWLAGRGGRREGGKTREGEGDGRTTYVLSVGRGSELSSTNRLFV